MNTIFNTLTNSERIILNTYHYYFPLSAVNILYLEILRIIMRSLEPSGYLKCINEIIAQLNAKKIKFHHFVLFPISMRKSHQ